MNGKRKNKANRKRIAAAVTALILAAVMVLALVAVAVRADSGDTAASAGSSLTGTSAASKSESQEESDSSSGKASENEVAGSSLALSPAVQRAGVYVENINVTDMTADEIQNAVDEKMQELSDENIVFYAGDNETSVKAGDLGLYYANRLVAEEAYSIGRGGNVLKRFLADRQLSSGKPIILDLDLRVTESSVRTAINGRMDILDSDPVPAGLKLQSDNTFRITPGKSGVKVNLSRSVRRVKNYIENEWHGGQGGVTLDAELTEASGSEGDLTKIKDFLGSGTTVYSTGDVNHDTNVELAARNIDGTVVYPGEEFSAEKAIGPTTEENGFLPGDTYADGKIIETYGGGVCQVSTTLYNAVLQAELEVTERHAHSNLVSYVQPGFDAAISEGTLDFRFINNTDAPIYIQAVTSGGNLTFNIFGHETRSSDRQVEYESRTSDPVDVTTVYTTDSSVDFGTISQSGGIQGISADLYKIVYVNGEQESEELVDHSVYAMMPLTYTVGTKNADAETLAAINAAVASQDLYAVETAVGNGSVVTSPAVEN